MSNSYYTSLSSAQDLLDFLLNLQNDGFVLADLDLEMEYEVEISEEGYAQDYTQIVISPSAQMKERGKLNPTLIISP